MRACSAIAGILLAACAAPALGQTCVFSISPASSNFSAAGGNDIINVSLTSGPATCSRTATSNANWITISFGTPGTGNGTVGFTVQANPFIVERSGTISVAGSTFTVTQSAGSCTYSISPSSSNVSANGGSGSFNLTVGANTCPWTAVSSSPDWLIITSATSGAGSATIKYTASSNPTTASRSATIATGGQSFTVTQAGLCALTLNPPSASVASLGATGTIAVQASGSSCAWNAVSNNDWLTLTGATSGSGNGTVAYTAAPNTTLQDRTGSITIGNTGFTVLQSGSSCNFTLSNRGQSLPSSGGTGSFLVTSSCPWTPSTNAAWITITSGASTTGSGTVTFLVGGNTGTADRTGVITVGSQSYAIQQTGVACAVVLGTSAFAAPAGGASASFHVSAGEGCGWTAATTAPWITLAATAVSGEGDVSITVAPNTTPQARTATITVANQIFKVTQEAANCDFNIAPAQATFAASGGAGSIRIIGACAWSAVAGAGWIALATPASGTDNADLRYTIATNTSSDARSSTIRIAGQTVTIVQSGKDCVISVLPTGVELPGRGGSAAVTVSGSKGCRWEPAKSESWLSVPTWSAVDGSGTVTIAAKPNPAPGPRYGTVVIAGQPVVVAQAGLEISIRAEGVLNAASFAAGPVAPGEIVTIFGEGMGPADAVKYSLEPDGQHIASMLGAAQVLFDGIPAPLIYVSDTQLSAIVPYSVGGAAASTELRVLNQGVSSPPVTLSVAPAAPAIFTLNASGKGAGAVLNQDNSLNAPANAAARNSIIQIFATGEGQTTPPGEDGKLATGAVLPKPRLAVTVQIGGQAATVLYAGAAPCQVAGLFQVNARIPQNVVPGSAVPVIIRVGTVASQNGVTIAVK